MGRTMLLVTILMTTIYAAIMTTLQRNVLAMPNIIARSILTKQAESVSDYALRNAVQNSIYYGQQTGEEAYIKWDEYYDNFKIQDCHVDSINYTFVSGTNKSYRAISHVSGELMGQTVKYRAEIAFSFPVVAILDMDYCIYLEMNQPQFNPGVGDMVWDTSDNDNDANFAGNVDTRPHGSGVDGWKAASFNESSGGVDGRIWHDGNATMVVASNFSIITFAKINQGSPRATLVWLPIDPNGAGVATAGWGNVRRSPTGSIWYNNNRIYFTATAPAFGTGSPVTIQCDAAYTPVGKWPHNKDPWHHFALTYNRGVVKGYINGLPVATASNPLQAIHKPAAFQNKGIYLGREFYGTWQSGDVFNHFRGMMDQVGLVPRTLSDAEIATYVSQVLTPTTVQYIRD